MKCLRNVLPAEHLVWSFANERIAHDEMPMQHCTPLAPNVEASLTQSELARARAWDDFELGQLWSKLASGSWKVASLVNGSTHVYMHVTESVEPAPEPLSSTEYGVLRRILLGERQKAIAMSTGHSCSAISATHHRALTRIGIRCCLWDVPVMLFMAAHEAHGMSQRASARLSLLEREGPSQWVVSAPWPDLILEGLLAPAERAVTRLLLSGHAHLEIARLRRASVRTVANQLHSAFRKAGVSGRTELLCKLLRNRPEPPCLHIHGPPEG